MVNQAADLALAATALVRLSDKSTGVPRQNQRFVDLACVGVMIDKGPVRK
ncbi:hypothetical protein [Pacificibacter maritimus]|nr:hypothetical protein [Pacificibacter maritimus]